MKMVIRLLQFHMPQFIKKLQLRQLIKISEQTFNCPCPDSNVANYDEALRIFAVFTKEQAEKALSDKINTEIVQRSLRNNSFRVGLRLRKILRISKQDDIAALIQLLYRNIGIELENSPPLNITVHNCYFSDYYSSAVCGFIAGMDDGIISGLNGGGKLEFQKRITEGFSCCQASLRSRKPASSGLHKERI